MRLSEWRATAPSKGAGGPMVAAVIDAVIDSLGADADPHCWVAWGDEPAVRYTILIPTEAGLITSFVRVNIPAEGPRATTRLVRWSRVAIGKLQIETQGGHRLLSFQIEQLVLRGTDASADRVAAFAMRVIAAIDGRSIPADVVRSGRRSRAKSAAAPGKGRPSAARSSSAKPIGPAGSTTPRGPASATAARPAKGSPR